MKTTMNNFKRILAGICLLASTFSYAQNVGINATGAAPDVSAMLDVNATNKGFLMPRVALTGTTDATTITTPATSLLVYNTATAGGVVPGYYYNSGTPAAPVWTPFSNPSSPSKFTVPFGCPNSNIDNTPSPYGGPNTYNDANQNKNYGNPATTAPNQNYYFSEAIFCANSNCTFNGMNGYYTPFSTAATSVVVSLYRFRQVPGSTPPMGVLVGTTTITGTNVANIFSFSIPAPATPFTAQAGDLFLLFANTSNSVSVISWMYGSLEFINN